MSNYTKAFWCLPVPAFLDMFFVKRKCFFFLDLGKSCANFLYIFFCQVIFTLSASINKNNNRCRGTKKWKKNFFFKTFEGKFNTHTKKKLVVEPHWIIFVTKINAGKTIFKSYIKNMFCLLFQFSIEKKTRKEVYFQSTFGKAMTTKWRDFLTLVPHTLKVGAKIV